MKKKSLRRRIIEACAVLVGTAIACTALIKPEAFVNAIGWVPVSTIPTNNYYVGEAQSVAKGIQLLPNPEDGLIYQYRCTWWSVDQKNRIMMANGHCYNEDVVKLGVQEHPFTMTFPNGRTASCNNIIAYSPWEGLDYMAVQCQDEIPPALTIDMKTKLKLNDKLVHISWNCDYVEEGATGDSQCEIIPMIDFTQDCRVTQVEFRGGVDFLQGCDSLGGSSGSPVHLEANGLVIGLHHSGRFFRDSRKFGDANGSVHIRKVVEDIRSKGIRIEFDTNEDDQEIKEPKKEPIDNPINVDVKVNTEDLTFLELINLIIEAIKRLFS